MLTRTHPQHPVRFPSPDTAKPPDDSRDTIIAALVWLPFIDVGLAFVVSGSGAGAALIAGLAVAFVAQVILVTLVIRMLRQ